MQENTLIAEKGEGRKSLNQARLVKVSLLFIKNKRFLKMFFKIQKKDPSDSAQIVRRFCTSLWYISTFNCEGKPGELDTPHRETERHSEQHLM